ncbi:hypothetical protein F2P81_025445 [Scophthalmus maximus]|uniref:Uncharacterized protein n=1 Tax=Scophthalmus maximus TaxID=52904 RepID=A0A6A4RPZ8_SCOMX|nr:hypothetical protein F2P81_025445 [Scophthalmus maximus]
MSQLRLVSVVFAPSGLFGDCSPKPQTPTRSSQPRALERLRLKCSRSLSAAVRVFPFDFPSELCGGEDEGMSAGWEQHGCSRPPAARGGGRKLYRHVLTETVQTRPVIHLSPVGEQTVVAGDRGLQIRRIRRRIRSVMLRYTKPKGNVPALPETHVTIIRRSVTDVDVRKWLLPPPACPDPTSDALTMRNLKQRKVERESEEKLWRICQTEELVGRGGRGRERERERGCESRRRRCFSAERHASLPPPDTTGGHGQGAECGFKSSSGRLQATRGDQEVLCDYDPTVADRYRLVMNDEKLLTVGIGGKTPRRVFGKCVITDGRRRTRRRGRSVVVGRMNVTIVDHFKNRTEEQNVTDDGDSQKPSKRELS